MRMIAGSKFISSKDGKKKKGDVHVIHGQTLIITHGSCQFVTDLVYACFRESDKIKGFINPKDLISKAYLQVKPQGTCTACVVTLNERSLHALNVGDNGFIIIRDEEILYESPMQRHNYKTPYQLGSDLPEEITLTEVEPGDIIVAGSAGLFNNLFSQQIKDVVIKEIRKNTAPKMIAAELAKKASEISTDKDRHTPYSKAAYQEGKRHRGGKIGDITAIFSFILPN